VLFNFLYFILKKNTKNSNESLTKLNCFFTNNIVGGG